MSRIVFFDELATPQKVLRVTGPSVGPGQYAGRTDVLIEPDMSAVATEDADRNLTDLSDRRYWKVSGNAVIDFTAGEIAAQDAAETAAADLSGRESAKNGLLGFGGEGQLLRAFADIVKDELNILRGQWGDFQTEVAAANNLADLKARVAAMPSLPDRNLTQLRNAIDARIDDGSVDS